MKENRRFWLTIPSKIVQRPIIWELGHRFKLVTNIGQASVTSELGIVSLSIDGQRAEIKKAIAWLEKLGVKVDQMGEIIIDRASKTNVPGVYAAGDVVNTEFKQAITGVAEGVHAAYSAYQYVMNDYVMAANDENGEKK